MEVFLVTYYLRRSDVVEIQIPPAFSYKCAKCVKTSTYSVRRIQYEFNRLLKGKDLFLPAIYNITHQSTLNTQHFDRLWLWSPCPWSPWPPPPAASSSCAPPPPSTSFVRRTCRKEKLLRCRWTAVAVAVARELSNIVLPLNCDLCLRPMVRREVVVVVLARGEEKGCSYSTMNHWAKEVAVGRSREMNMCVCVRAWERGRGSGAIIFDNHSDDDKAY